MEFKQLTVGRDLYAEKIAPYLKLNSFNKEHPTTRVFGSTVYLLKDGLVQVYYNFETNKMVMSINEPNSKKPFFKDLEKLVKEEN
jgi:hypothetical protein